jgi:transcriptional regulator with XRE-family HTH domain
MMLNLSKLHSQKEAMFSSLRDRVKAYLEKFEYTQKQISAVIGVSQSHLADFLSGRRGLSDITFSKIEHVLSLNATQRKLQFYRGGSTGSRMCNLQAKGKNVKGQVKFGDSYGDVIDETHAAFQKINQNRMEP